ncbi:MAG: tetratricopeptide repeat protein [Candidatus Omnitrophica bacterium]|nr:tetratricopeptide repeat protein [Candidatus Omnitrophota bacterium]
MKKLTLLQRVNAFIIGIFLTVLFLELILQFSGMVFFGIQSFRNRPDDHHSKTVKILCVGESTTALGGNSAYPHQLETILNKRSPQHQYHVINKGIPGITTPAIVYDLPRYIRKYHPDYIIAMMGINDQQYGLGQNMQPSRAEFLFTKEPYKYFKTLKLIYLSYEHLKAHIEHGSKKRGEYFLNHGRHAEAIKVFQKYTHNNPKDVEGYLLLAKVYRWEGMFDQAIAILNEALEQFPEHITVLTELAHLWIETNTFSKAEYYLNTAAKNNPKNPKLLYTSGLLFKKQGQLDKAETSLQEAIAVGYNAYDALFHLGEVYLNQQKFTQARDALMKAVALEPDNDQAYNAALYAFQGLNDQTGFRNMQAKREQVLLNRNNPVTRQSFQKLHALARQNGIPLVIVQYPMLPVEPLKRMFLEPNHVLFVDNQEVFKNAVQTEGFNAVFTDNFAGTFGHCTPRGNRILAENIAELIVNSKP